MSLIWIFIGVDGIVGGYAPSLFGAYGFSARVILTSTIGSIIGLVLYKKMDLE